MLLFREVTETKNDIRARYIDCKNRNDVVGENTIGGYTWRKQVEIFPRSLEDRYGFVFSCDNNLRNRFFHVDILKSMWIYYYLVLVYPHSF